MKLLSLCLLFAALYPLIQVATTFQWASTSLEDRARLWVCPGSDVRLLWTFSTSYTETIIDLQWFFQGQGQTERVLASYVDDTFFTHDADHVEYVQPAGLHLEGFKFDYEGRYTVRVNIRNSSGFSGTYARTTLVTQVVLPVIATGHLVTREGNGPIFDDVSGQWYVQMECGDVTSRGQPPLDVLWTDPSGQTLHSSAVHNGTFLLQLFPPVQPGAYTCSLDNSTSARCLDPNTLRRQPSVRQHGNDADLAILKASNAQLKQQNQQLRRDAERQRQQMVQLAADHQQLLHNHTSLQDAASNLTAALDQCQNAQRYRNCLEAQRDGQRSGVTTIYLSDDTPVNVNCDQDTDGGGWLVFQRRVDGSVNFQRNWTDYQHGFGSVCGEYWLGLDTLHMLTTTQTCDLRVDLGDWSNTTAFAVYSNFWVGSSQDLYQLHVSSYTNGTAGDSLMSHNGQHFSTYDSDNDNDNQGRNCAAIFHGGWWFFGCYDVNLNGDYKTSYNHVSDHTGIVWKDFHPDIYSLKSAEMKIRPAVTVV